MISFLFNVLTTSLLPPYHFAQILDHNDVYCTQYFNQTYYSDNSNPPLNHETLIIIVGGANKFDSTILELPHIQQLRENTKALLFGLEHRYFGTSLPNISINSSSNCKYNNNYNDNYNSNYYNNFDHNYDDNSNNNNSNNNELNLEIENYTFLTVDQALSDLANFIKYLQQIHCSSQKCKVILAGSEYAGSLSVWFKIKFPHFVDAVWASSAPLNAQVDFTGASVAAGGRVFNYDHNCYNSLREFLYKFDKLRPGDFFHIFGFPDDLNDTSSFSIISDFIEYISLNETLQPMLQKLCMNVEMENFARVFNETFSLLNLNSLSIDPFRVENDRRAMAYLNCHELNWMKISSPNIGPSFKLGSNNISNQYHREVCNYLFDYMPPTPADYRKLDLFNLKFGGRKPGVKFTVFSTALYDPWEYLEIVSTFNSSELFIQSYGNHSIGADLISNFDSPELTLARNNVILKLTEWVNGCNNNCGNHGYCYFGKCQCKKDYTGDQCETRVMKYDNYKLLSITSTLLPTLMFLLIGGVLWFVNIKLIDQTVAPRH
ncbi:hypothetical protein TRFO_10354 [Tritrichomonas foetus]|uniref:EGF-like domain-containing protein n=1 Tax=Tritrichomonas foetus TaxID=1144522 RepID=A0A1J4J991_9EUKA|nr:hypothetical protein TRFO_10354 [Tritrichomonas foetus]|eukprot:OHS95712.1 hypothetical protein TRFO_10354 [Tritrichomonas foetus]